MKSLNYLYKYRFMKTHGSHKVVGWNSSGAGAGAGAGSLE